VVQDTVYEGNRQEKKIEDTTDWYAEDSQHNVWYFGEIAQNFNEEGILENINGSWTAGVEGAKPGIVMFAYPDQHKGQTYRQEFALGEAEDMATIVKILNEAEFAAVQGAERVPAKYKTGKTFLHTKDFSAFEPGVVEDKYYASDVGNVLIVKPDGAIEVLVDKTP
jgi:hypothetical protein